MTDHEKYNVNFFKPLTDHARANKKIIITLAVIWAVAVFGFQILLILLNQPTPEKNFTTFESIWPAVVENTDEIQKISERLATIDILASFLLQYRDNCAKSPKFSGHPVNFQRYQGLSPCFQPTPSLKGTL